MQPRRGPAVGSPEPQRSALCPHGSAPRPQPRLPRAATWRQRRAGPAARPAALGLRAPSLRTASGLTLKTFLIAHLLPTTAQRPSRTAVAVGR